MRKRQFVNGDQIREKFMYNGDMHLGRYGYVVDYIDDYTVSILWTRDGYGNLLISSGRMHPLNIVPTGKHYRQIPHK